MRWKRAQLRPVVNNTKGAREEHVVALETEQRLNKRTIGRTEAAEAECEDRVGCWLQHVSAFLLSEPSNALCAWSTVVSHFATSMDIQVVGCQRTDAIHHLNQNPMLRDLKCFARATWIRKTSFHEIEVRPVCKCGRSPSVSLIDVFIWTNGTIHDGAVGGRWLLHYPLPQVRGARADTNQAVSFECLNAWIHFLFLLFLSLRAVASLSFVMRLWWGCMWNMTSGHLDEMSIRGKQAKRMNPQLWKPFLRDFVYLNQSCFCVFTLYHKDFFNTFSRSTSHIKLPLSRLRLTNYNYIIINIIINIIVFRHMLRSTC